MKREEVREGERRGREQLVHIRATPKVHLSFCGLMLTIQDVHPDHTQTPSPLDPSWIVIRLCKAYAQTTPRPRALWSYKPCSQTIPHTPSLMEPDEVIPHIARIALLGLAQELRAGAHFFTSIKCFVILQCRVVVLLQTVKSICLIPTQWIYSWRICHRTQWSS